MMDKALTVFIWIWSTFGIGVNVIAIVSFFVFADSLWEGYGRFAETYSPFNIFNWIAELILFAPAIGAAAWRERRRNRSARPSVS